ncbi:hypothetical protein GCM10011297_13670 [Bacterioplanes sanyensis]|uniref:GIN domain-containing protein n=1 Tax=Bacterioplanes sanyensis TaxID=1249553 RepID=UPI001674028C|nr:DUF2807 domain-containing protein [Bacterioplanes sanyensis]GGY41918.1 hypothetical protein GCM10011297_13670 [Bacterioplanes sanyensis]
MMKWMMVFCLWVNVVWAEPEDATLVSQALGGSAFTQVVISAPVAVQIVQAEQYGVWLQAPSALHSALRLKQAGARLKVHWQPDARVKALANTSDVKIKIALPRLDLVEMLGSGNLYLAAMTQPKLHIINRGSGEVYSTNLTTEALELSLQGSGDIKGQIWQVNTLMINSSGSADVELGRLTAERLNANSAGQGDIEIYEASSVAKLNLQMLGSGDFEAPALVVDDAVIALLGSSDVTLTVAQHLDANILGSGDVRYAGNPEVNARQLGSGSVKPLEDETL